MEISPGQRWVDDHNEDDTLDVLERVSFGKLAGLWRVRLSNGQTNLCVDDEYFNYCRYVGPAPSLPFEPMREGEPYRPEPRSRPEV
jgi:hypothetical protein